MRRNGRRGGQRCAIITTITSICAAPTRTRRHGSSRQCSKPRLHAASIRPARSILAAVHNDAAWCQKVLIAPPHPHEPSVAAPPFPHYELEHIGLTVDDVDAAAEELLAKGRRDRCWPAYSQPWATP